MQFGNLGPVIAIVILLALMPHLPANMDKR